MCITKNEILELHQIIQTMNSISDEKERKSYLNNTVEDVDLFISTLKGINKNQLKISEKPTTSYSKTHQYSRDMIIELFENNNLDDIVKKYSKQELTDMYLTFFTSKPLASYNKNRIAQCIHNYILAMNRTKALLG